MQVITFFEMKHSVYDNDKNEIYIIWSDFVYLF